MTVNQEMEVEVWRRGGGGEGEEGEAPFKKPVDWIGILKHCNAPLHLRRVLRELNQIKRLPSANI